MSACFFLVVPVLGTIHQDLPDSPQQPHCSCFLPTPCSFQDAVTSTCLNSLHTWLAHSLTTLCHLLPLLPLHPLPSFIASCLVAKSPSSLVSLSWLPYSIFVSAPGSSCGSPCPSYSSWVSPPSGDDKSLPCASPSPSRYLWKKSPCLSLPSPTLITVSPLKPTPNPNIWLSLLFIYLFGCTGF